MIKASTTEEINKAIQDNLNLVIKAGTGHCGACMLVESRLVEVQKETNKFEICVVDTDECNDSVLDDFNIAGIPTVMFYKEGKMIYKLIRPVEKDKLLEIVNRF